MGTDSIRQAHQGSPRGENRLVQHTVKADRPNQGIPVVHKGLGIHATHRGSGRAMAVPCLRTYENSDGEYPQHRNADHVSCAWGGGAECGVINSIHVALGQGAVRMSQGGLFLYPCDGK